MSNYYDLMRQSIIGAVIKKYPDFVLGKIVEESCPYKALMEAPINIFDAELLYSNVIGNYYDAIAKEIMRHMPLNDGDKK